MKAISGAGAGGITVTTTNAVTMSSTNGVVQSIIQSTTFRCILYRKCMSMYLHNILQRRQSAEGRWDESSAQQELPLPPAAIRWHRFPYRRPDLNKTFNPKPENLPVGTRLDRHERFVETWANICLPVLEKVAQFTNERGREVEGAAWRDVDFVTFAKFECVLLRMAHVRRNRLKDCFSTTKGDPVVRQLNLSFKAFSAIYRNLRMFSASEASASGASNRNSAATFDGLFGIRPECLYDSIPTGQVTSGGHVHR